MQQLTRQASPVLSSWGQLLRVHAAVTRELNAALSESHGLTIGEFEVLLRLSQAPDHSMRRIDLADQVLLSPSGITRMLDRLSAAGLVANASCPTDARVHYAVLTEDGVAKVEVCSNAHLAAVERLFADRLDAEELRTLHELLSRLPAVDDEACDQIGDTRPANRPRNRSAT